MTAATSTATEPPADAGLCALLVSRGLARDEARRLAAAWDAGIADCVHKSPVRCASARRFVTTVLALALGNAGPDEVRS